MMMDPLWSETCWSTFKYFIILIVSTSYILCISWIIKCLQLMHGANMKIIHWCTGWQKKRKLLKSIVAAMYSWQHCRTGNLSYRQPRHFSNHGSDLKRQVIMVQFLSIIFFIISSIFVGFFKSSRFLCHPVYIKFVFPRPSFKYFR